MIVSFDFVLKDFDLNFFWKWNDFKSYLQFVIFFFVVGGLVMRMFIHFSLFVETIGNNEPSNFRLKNLNYNCIFI